MPVFFIWKISKNSGLKIRNPEIHCIIYHENGGRDSSTKIRPALHAPESMDIVPCFL